MPPIHPKTPPPTEKYGLPIGYHPFHKNAFINYQLNRWHSLGYARKEDMQEIGSRISTFEEYVQEFTQAAEVAIEENRLQQAAMYVRASEFFIPPSSSEKIPTYTRYIELFDHAFASELYDRFLVPYEGSQLRGMHFPSRQDETKGTLVAFGGFDSMIEEFFCMWKFFAEHGYEVIAFEGPGQGGSLRIHDLAFDHDWEKPVGAVLDHFNCEEATLLGVSMGGYWAIRAAAFEKRVKRVIAFPPVYDWLEMTNGFNRWLVKVLLKVPNLMNAMIKAKMNVKILRHAIHQAMFISQGKRPIDGALWLLGMNKEHIHSHLVDQEVFLLTGENDAFQPPKLLDRQADALTNALSVNTYVFKQEDHADQHCQMGNMGLALETMLSGWIISMSCIYRLKGEGGFYPDYSLCHPEQFPHVILSVCEGSCYSLVPQAWETPPAPDGPLNGAWLV